MNQYELIQKIGDGTFSQVFRARNVNNNKHYAIKYMKKKIDTLDKVRKLNQIKALRLLTPHQNIIRFIEVLYDQPTGKITSSGKLAIVFQLMEQNLFERLKTQKNITMNKIKLYMYQLLKSINHSHKKGIFHRDIKPENVLLTNDYVKLADFGSCKGIKSQMPHTQYISTRWYRAPQCLMTDGYYDQKMDIWGFGCVLFQIVTKYPLFPGRNQMDQIHRIHNVFGTPNNQILQRFKARATHMQFNFTYKKGLGLQRLVPKGQRDLLDLLYKLLIYDPNQRISAQQALDHCFFHPVNELSNPNQLRLTYFNPQNQWNNASPSPAKKKKLKNTYVGSFKKKEEIDSLLPPIGLQMGVYGMGQTVKNKNVFVKPLSPYKKVKSKLNNV